MESSVLKSAFRRERYNTAVAKLSCTYVLAIALAPTAYPAAGLVILEPLLAQSRHTPQPQAAISSC